MENKSYMKEFTKGIFKENPVFVLLLGLCPTLGVTGSAINGMAMGLATLAVLVLSNIIISALKTVIPNKIRIPAYIMVIATLVTVVKMLMEAYLPILYSVLGLFIPLIVVNCIILGRAESYASKNSVFYSILDGLGIGIGFTLALTFLGAVRELLGAGSIFGFKIFEFFINNVLNLKMEWQPAIIFILPPGAFLSIGFIIAGINLLKRKK